MNIDVKEIIKKKVELIKYLEKIELLLSKKKYLDIKYRIKLYGVLTPRLLVKDYIKCDNNGVYLSRLVVPVQSFISSFSELRMVIKQSFIRNKIVTDKFTILQASSLKVDIKRMNIIKNSNLIESINIIHFYLSMSFKIIKKVAQFFSIRLDDDKKNKLKIELELLRREISMQIIQFNGDYYEYIGNSEEDPSFIIEYHKSAFCSDLVIAHIFKAINNDAFRDNLLLNKVYCNNSILFMKDK